MESTARRMESELLVRCLEEPKGKESSREGHGEGQVQRQGQIKATRGGVLRQRCLARWCFIVFFALTVFIGKGSTVRSHHEGHANVDGNVDGCPGGGQADFERFAGSRCTPGPQEGSVQSESTTQSLCEGQQTEGGARQEAQTIQSLQGLDQRPTGSGDQEVRVRCPGAQGSFDVGGGPVGADREGYGCRGGTGASRGQRVGPLRAHHGFRRGDEGAEQVEAYAGTASPLPSREPEPQTHGPELCREDGTDADAAGQSARINGATEFHEYGTAGDCEGICINSELTSESESAEERSIGAIWSGKQIETTRRPLHAAGYRWQRSQRGEEGEDRGRKDRREDCRYGLIANTQMDSMKNSCGCRGCRWRYDIDKPSLCDDISSGSSYCPWCNLHGNGISIGGISSICGTHQGSLWLAECGRLEISNSGKVELSQVGIDGTSFDIDQGHERQEKGCTLSHESVGHDISLQMHSQENSNGCSGSPAWCVARGNFGPVQHGIQFWDNNVAVDTFAPLAQENRSIWVSGSLESTWCSVVAFESTMLGSGHFVNWRVKTGWGCTQCAILFNVVDLDILHEKTERGCTRRVHSTFAVIDPERGHRQGDILSCSGNLHVVHNFSTQRSQEGTSCENEDGLRIIFKLFLWSHWFGSSLVLIGQMMIFVVKRLFFMNYDSRQPTDISDFAWQSLRLFFISVVVFWQALRPITPRAKRSVAVGRVRVQRRCRHYKALVWQALWMCVMVSNAHAIDVHQGICSTMPPGLSTPVSSKIDPDDVLEETFMDDIYVALPNDENEALDLPPRHLWAAGDSARARFEVITQQYPQRATIDTYGLRNVYLGNRFARLQSTSFDEILAVVAGLWSAYSQGHHMRIFTADPQPPDCPPESIVFIVEFPTLDQDNTVARPVLVDTIQNGDITDRRTGYADRRTRAGSVFAVPGLEGICAPSGMDDCLLFHNDRFHPPDEAVEIQYGNYMTVHHTTFQVRYAAYLNRFPRAQQFVRDFLWRCTHFGIQEYWLNVHFTSGRLGERHQPNILAWSRPHCRDIPSLLTEVTAEWANQGADHRSTLIVVSPQSALQNDQSTIHLILTTAQIPNWVPVLFSVYVHFDGMRAQKVETHAWTLPPQGPISDYIHLVGYGEFVRSLALSHHISLGRTRFEGDETMLNLQTGGNYALHIHLQSVVDFVAATARHLVNTRPLNDTSSDDVEDASMMQVLHQQTKKIRGEKIEARILDAANGAETALGEFVNPLPRTIGEAIRQPRIIRLFPDWQELCSVMSVRGENEGDFVTLHTYAIRDQHIGERTTQVAIYSQSAVIQAVQHLWHDEILGRSFQIFVLNPQPTDLPVHSVGLLVEINLLAWDLVLSWNLVSCFGGPLLGSYSIVSCFGGPLLGSYSFIDCRYRHDECSNGSKKKGFSIRWCRCLTHHDMMASSEKDM